MFTLISKNKEQITRKTKTLKSKIILIIVKTLSDIHIQEKILIYRNSVGFHLGKDVTMTLFHLMMKISNLVLL